MTDVVSRPAQAQSPMDDLSPHVWARTSEMQIGVGDVYDTLDHPETDVPAHYNRRLACKGRIGVVYKVVGDRKVVVTVLPKLTAYAHYARGADGGAVLIEPEPEAAQQDMVERGPLAPSMNQLFLDQLELWGATFGRRHDAWVYVRMPGGGQLAVRPAGYTEDTTTDTAEKAYRMLGVSAKQFWQRTTKARTPRERVYVPPPGRSRATNGNGNGQAKTGRRVKLVEPAKPAKTGRRGPTKAGSAADKILQYFRSRPGEQLDFATVADATGIEVQIVRLRCGVLAKKGLLQRVGWGNYRSGWIEGGDETDQRMADINKELASTTDLVRRVELIQARIELLNGPGTVRIGGFSIDEDDVDPLDAEIDRLLDQLAPDGIGETHRDAAQRWRETTKAFIAELRS